MRNSIDLNGEWDFELLEEFPEKVEHINPTRKINIPSCVESYFPEVTEKQFYMYYSKTFTIKKRKNKRYFLIFGAVDYLTTVFFNGKLLGKHEGGFTSFEFEVTDLIEKENFIQIIVFDPIDDSRIDFKKIPHGKQNGDPNWYTNITGIWQGIRLEERPTFFLKNLTVKTSYLEKKIDCFYDISGDFDNIVLKLIKDEKEVIKKSFSKNDKINVNLDKVIAWSPENPQLYDLYIEVINGTNKDVIHKKIGFRDFQVANGKLLLNGKDFYMIGVLDQDFYPETLYTIPSKEYLKSNFLKLKKMGINTLRIHVKAPDPLYMELADEIGFIVWQDAPYFDSFSSSSSKKLESTIIKTLERDIYHPSLCIYSIINESWGINLDNKEHREWLEKMYHKIKSEYPDLILVDNSPCIGNYHLVSDINDYHFYASSLDREELWNTFIDDFSENPQNKFYKGYKKNADNLPLIISEFGNWSLPGIKWLYKNNEVFWMNRKFLGSDFTLAKGALERFETSELAKEFSIEEFFEVSTAYQLENLQLEISKIKSESSIRGYVITELADTFWECNGLLDFDRQYKYNPGKIKTINSLDNAFKAKSSNIFAGEQLELLIDSEKYPEEIKLYIDNKALDEQEYPIKTNKKNASSCITLETKTCDEGLHYLFIGSKENKFSIHFTVTRKENSNVLVARDIEEFSLDEVRSGKKIVLIIDKLNKNVEFESYKAKIIEKDGILSGDWISGFPWISKEFSSYFPNNTFLKVHSSLINGMPIIDAKGYTKRLSGITYGWFSDFYGYLDFIQIGKGKLFITTLNISKDEPLSMGILKVLEKI